MHVIRVAVVDDHPVVRTGLTALIEADPSMAMVASAADAAAARAIDVDPAPDVCVVDRRLPDADGIDLGVELKQRWPGTHVLVLTMDADPAGVIRSLGAGLDGYLLKDSDPAELRAAIRAAAEGSVVLGSSASAPVVAAAASTPATDPFEALDSRDREILALLVLGATVGEIAQRIFLSPKTVRNRTTGILSKLGVRTRAEAIAIGAARGIGAAIAPPNVGT
ncbi:MAG: response regulator transcription factor [Ilumatobacter sp.]|nr:response regulator transcription factor [Ilumatobacter sp.]